MSNDADSQITAHAPTGAMILGTFEAILGRAEIAYFYKDNDGALMFEHAGETEVFWDSSETQTRNGRAIFLCENGEEWTFEQLTFKDVDGNAIEAPRPSWDDNAPTPEDKTRMAARAMLAALSALLVAMETPRSRKAATAWDAARAALARAEAAGITPA